MKVMVYWVVMLCSLDTARRFGGTYYFHLQGQRIRQARNQQKQVASMLLASYWLLDVVF
jgi:hypothetical protein